MLSCKLLAIGCRLQAAGYQLSAIRLALLDILKLSTVNFKTRQSTEDKISIFGVCSSVGARESRRGLGSRESRFGTGDSGLGARDSGLENREPTAHSRKP